MRRVALAAATCGLVLAWVLHPTGGLAHVTTTNTVVFEREIVRILEAHCVVCHADGGATPRLVTYEETWLARDAVLAAVLDRSMPPWPAVSGYGDFANDNALTSRERQFIVSWVEGLGPRNVGERFSNTGGPSEQAVVVEGETGSVGAGPGAPDVTLPLPSQALAASEPGVARVVVDPGLTSERSVRAIEFAPGAAAGLRAASFFLDDDDQWLGSWTPWHGSMTLPEGAAYRLAPGARIRAELRYAGERSGGGALRLFFAESAASEPRGPAELAMDARAELPGSTVGLRLHAEERLERDIRIFAILPDLAPGARTLEVSVRRTDGSTDVLLFADYSKELTAAWRTPFLLREPVVVPAGSLLRATAYFDNATPTPREGRFRVRVTGY